MNRYVKRGEYLAKYNVPTEIDHEHNSWDRVRVSKSRGYTTLRCRICEHKIKLSNVDACEKEECSGKCGLLHVHKKKLKILERTLVFGSHLIDLIPLNSRPAEPHVVKSICDLLD